METNERASVVILRGRGKERLRQAMMQGLVKEELSADVNEVLREIDEVKGENARLIDHSKRVDVELGRYRDIYFKAIKSHEREKDRKARTRAAYAYSALFAAVFAIVLLSTVITRAIFG